MAFILLFLLVGWDGIDYRVLVLHWEPAYQQLSMLHVILGGGLLTH